MWESSPSSGNHREARHRPILLGASSEERPGSAWEQDDRAADLLSPEGLTGSSQTSG